MKAKEPLSELDRKILSHLRRGRLSIGHMRAFLQWDTVSEPVKAKLRPALEELVAKWESLKDDQGRIML